MDNSRVSRNTNTIFTIGHSNQTMDDFVGLLFQHNLTALADVRSNPYSRFNPHYDREELADSLKASGIKYVYFGRELGGRSNNQSCYDDGRIRYDRLARMPQFLDGLKRLIRGASTYRVAMMCAEKEPLHCHRTLLVGNELDERGFTVVHILLDGCLESHADAMTRLLQKFDLENDLFHRDLSRRELIAKAIARQARRVGHTMDQVSDETKWNDR